MLDQATKDRALAVALEIAENQDETSEMRLTAVATIMDVAQNENVAAAIENRE